MKNIRKLAFLLICILFSYPIWAIPNMYEEEEVVSYGQDRLHKYVHTATGMSVIWIENKDINASFTIGVKTPTHDDTGVNHIIEHTLFTGSDKYPSTTLFFDASNTYPHTFMNAMTSADRTVYPFSTPYKESFEKLLDIYLESIFHPTMLHQRNSFYEEAFHYNPITKECGGVVYNEMKGANHDLNRILFKEVRNSLYANTHYTNDSGGNVASIPFLSYEEFIMTYKAYYYPGNMVSVIYGDVEMDAVLNKLHEFIKEYPKREGKVNVCVEPSLIKEQRAIESDKLKNKGILIKSFLIKEEITPEKEWMLDLWINTYLMQEDSLFINELRQKGISFIDIQKDGDTKYPIYSIILQDIPLNQLESVKTSLGDVLEKIKRNPPYNEQIEKDIIAKNKLELHMMDTISNRGIVISENMVEAWAHDKPLDQYFRVKQWSEQVEALDKDLSGLLLESNYSNELLVLPKKEVVPTELTKPSLNWEEILTHLQDWHSQKSGQELPPIDLNRFILNPSLKYQHKKKAAQYILTEIDTDLLQTNVYIPTPHMEKEELPYLFFYAYMLQEVAKEVSPFTASFSSKNTMIYEKEGYIPYFTISMLSTDKNKPSYEAIEAVKELLLNKEEEWYQTKVLQWMEDFKKVGASNLLETLSVLNKAGMKDGKRYEYEMFFPLYKIKNEITLSPEIWIEKMQQINEKLQLNNQCYVALSGNKENIKNQYKQWDEQYAKVPKVKKQYGEYEWEELTKNMIYSFNGEVDYLMYSYDAGLKRLEGIDYVVASFATKNYLQPKIRIQKGAYGAGMSAIFPNSILLYTYRDPNYETSLKDILLMPTHLKDYIHPNTLDSAKANALSKFQNQTGLSENPFSQLEALHRIVLMGEDPSIFIKFQKQIVNTTPKALEKACDNLENLLKESILGICTSKKNNISF
jgi:Zn-dependent M16 (insulinase) family peptidase